MAYILTAVCLIAMATSVALADAARRRQANLEAIVAKRLEATERRIQRLRDDFCRYDAQTKTDRDNEQRTTAARRAASAGFYGLNSWYIQPDECNNVSHGHYWNRIGAW